MTDIDHIRKLLIEGYKRYEGQRLPLRSAAGRVCVASDKSSMNLVYAHTPFVRSLGEEIARKAILFALKAMGFLIYDSLLHIPGDTSNDKKPREEDFRDAIGRYFAVIDTVSVQNVEGYIRFEYSVWETQANEP